VSVRIHQGDAPTYYNEWEAYPARWLRNLIAAGELPPGDVDERDIRDLKGTDLERYTACHFFAGIGGWPLALRLAGWPADRPVWTGSCPCQPFSCAGKRKGEADERHLWPAFLRLIAECRPDTVFGEQVASRDGREWLAGVRADLENLGYAVGAADLCAAGVGAPHIRQRLFWVANTDCGRGGSWGSECEGQERRSSPVRATRDGRVADREGGTGGLPVRARGSWEAGVELERGGAIDGVALPCNAGPSRPGGDPQRQGAVERAGDGCREETGRMGDASGPRREGRQGERCDDGQECPPIERAGGQPNPWDGAAWLPCADGKARRVEPSILPLADGVPCRVGRIRAYGNAIVPQVAAQFVRAFLECEGER